MTFFKTQSYGCLSVVFCCFFFFFCGGIKEIQETTHVHSIIDHFIVYSFFLGGGVKTETCQYLFVHAYIYIYVWSRVPCCYPPYGPPGPPAPGPRPRAPGSWHLQKEPLGSYLWNPTPLRSYGNHCPCVSTGESLFQGFLCGAKWISQPSTVALGFKRLGTKLYTRFSVVKTAFICKGSWRL